MTSSLLTKKIGGSPKQEETRVISTERIGPTQAACVTAEGLLHKYGVVLRKMKPPPIVQRNIGIIEVKELLGLITYKQNS